MSAYFCAVHDPEAEYFESVQSDNSFAKSFQPHGICELNTCGCMERREALLIDFLILTLSKKDSI